ncbi:LOG family protein [Akkermansiaceae bacterium]|nr:LOG family protein [Akkermansiaceae bacterium]MDB4300031.1 LOG family protein [bacterium]MDB4452124.1 LOG family protein [Akkermansiaceae bacterium]
MSKKERREKMPKRSDFTGGVVSNVACSFVGSSGEKSVDEKIMALASELASEDRACLLAEMITTAVRMARGNTEMSDFKLANRTLRELRESNEVFYPYRSFRKVALFGSARTKSDEAEYQTAVEFSHKMKELGFMTITGAGPGIMAAGNEGATRDFSFGLNITLPFEASANAFIKGDPKLIDYDFFFTRKLAFVKEAAAAVGLPGGVGTMDEVFEALTLIQTGKVTVYPIICLDSKGGTYWKAWNQFITEHLFRLGLISATDFHLFKVTDDVDEAIEEIVKFYRVFHSYRYIGDQLVLRLSEELTDGAVRKLTEDFEDILKVGKIEKCDALEEEENEPELADLYRLKLRHKRRDFGRLRQLINEINDSEIES